MQSMSLLHSFLHLWDTLHFVRPNFLMFSTNPSFCIFPDDRISAPLSRYDRGSSHRILESCSILILFARQFCQVVLLWMPTVALSIAATVPWNFCCVSLQRCVNYLVLTRYPEDKSCRAWCIGSVRLYENGRPMYDDQGEFYVIPLKFSVHNLNYEYLLFLFVGNFLDENGYRADNLPTLPRKLHYSLSLPVVLREFLIYLVFCIFFSLGSIIRCLGV